MKITAILTLAFFPFTARAVPRTFSGGGADTNWNTPANWTPTGPPAAADNLIFALGAISSNNNLSAATFHDLDFNARHSLTGNGFSLTHGITASPVRGLNGVTIAQGITLGLDQTFSLTSGTMTITGALALNGRLLTASVTDGDTLTLATVGGTGTGSRIVKDGPGTLRISSSAVNEGGITINAGTLDVPGIISGGAVTVNGGTLDVPGFISGNPVTLNGGQLTGDGTLGAVTATGGEIVPAGGDLSISGGLTLTPGAKVFAKLTGPGQADIVMVTGGAVDLGGAELVVDATAYQPVWDEDFTLLTKNSTGPITGTFAGLLQGAEVRINATTVGRISYTGGNGNDVVLDIISTTRIWDGGHTINDNWDEAENWNLNIRPNFGDELVFPDPIAVSDQGMDNNFPNNTIFRRLVFEGQHFTIRGARFRLSHGIFVAPAGLPILDTSVELAQDQTFDLGNNSILHLDLLDEIDTAGHTLRLSGGGTIDGTISGTGGVVIPVSTAPGIGFTARNTYTGTTLIEAGGSLRIVKQSGAGAEGTLGGPETPTRVAGTLNVHNDHQTLRFKVNENLVLLPGGAVHSGGIDDIAGFSTVTEFAGSMTLEGPANVVFDVLHGKNEISGTIQGNGNLSFQSDSDIAIIGTQANTFTGSLTLDAHLVELNKSAAGVLAVPCEALTISSDAGFSEVVTRQDEQIADNCHVTIADKGILSLGNVTGRTETIGSLTMRADSVILGTVGGESQLKLNGNIQARDGTGGQFPQQPVLSVATEIRGTPCIIDVGSGTELVTASTRPVTRIGSASIRKTGPGKMRILGPITVPCEILSGEMSFADNGAGSPVTLNGGILGGEGSCGSITSAAGGGVVGPGNSTGILTSGSVLWNAATTLKIEITNATAGSGHDRLVVLGTVSPGATLQLVELAGFNVTIDAEVLVLLNDGSDPTGAFAGLPEGAFIPASTDGWKISYTGGDGNDVMLTRAVTPPSDAAPVVTNVTLGNPDVNGNRPVTIAGKGTPGASYRLENSVNLSQWTPDGDPQTAAAGTGVLNFTSSASPPVRLKQFWRIKRL